MPGHSTMPPTPGFTYGAAVEWYHGNWTLRGGLFDLSIVPNSTGLDPHFGQFQWVGEIEHRHALWGQPGKVMVNGFFGRGRMGSFQDAINLAELTGNAADITLVRQYRSRGGMTIAAEQQIVPNVAVFARAGVANGQIEPYEYTDIDQTIAEGLSLKGKLVGTAGRHLRPCRHRQRNFSRASGLPRCRGPGHPGRGWNASERRPREDHRDLLQIPHFCLADD